MLRRISSLIVKMIDCISFMIDSVYGFFVKKTFDRCGKNVMIKPLSSIIKGNGNISICDNVRIARYAVIYATDAKLFIGSKVGIAPYFCVVTGNHNFACSGHFMFDGNYEKKEGDDQDVIIEGDNWIGMGVKILSGVHIGRGSVIAAGAVVNKSFPPYSIIGGVPARLLKYRFSIDEILKHEEKLYPESQRFSRTQLEEYRSQI